MRERMRLHCFTLWLDVMVRRPFHQSTGSMLAQANLSRNQRKAPLKFGFPEPVEVFEFSVEEEEEEDEDGEMEKDMKMEMKMEKQKEIHKCLESTCAESSSFSKACCII